MHYLYFVLIKKEECSTSNNAQEHANNLLENEGFTAQGFFGSGKADWYEIGGRWSGCLTECLMPLEYREELKKLYENSRTTNEEYEALWKKYKGDGKCPQTREHNWHRGQSDDNARILTKKLYEGLKQTYPETEIYCEEDCIETTIEQLQHDLYNLDNAEELFNNYWIVTVDYHN